MTEPRILTVTQLTEQIKGLLEGGLGMLWLAGEVTNLRKQSSGHFYFTIKDEASAIGAVCFRGEALRQAMDWGRLADGVAVLVQGRLSVYEARGTYQLVVKTIQLQGQGRLQLEFERLKRQLQQEGLFDVERKKALPSWPRRIGVLTSATGAALQDFLSILQRRHFWGDLFVFPCLVQGEGAAASIIKQLERAGTWDLDLLVLTRGGGSLEDLWCFNEEALVRAVARCPHPTLSAVGHQIDFTLCDFVADWRSETPSAAAELISSSALALTTRYEQALERLQRTSQFFFQKKRETLLRALQRLFSKSPSRRIDRAWLRADELALRLQDFMDQTLESRQDTLRRLAQRLERLPLTRQLSDYSSRLQHRAPTLLKATQHALRRLEEHLAVNALRLHNASQSATLRRGYALVRTLDGLAVPRAQSATPSTCLQVEWADGSWVVHTLDKL